MSYFACTFILIILHVNIVSLIIIIMYMYQCMCMYNNCSIDILMNNYTTTIINTHRAKILVYTWPQMVDTQMLFNICWNLKQILINLIQ